MGSDVRHYGLPVQGNQVAALLSDNSAKKRIRDYVERPGLVNEWGFRAWLLCSRLEDWLVPARRRARQFDEEFDAKRGIETGGWVHLGGLAIESANLAAGTHYEGIGVDLFREALGQLPIRHEEFLFVDFGSGKGRALLLASEWPFTQILGVEFSPQLHHIAQDNISTYRSAEQKCRTIESVCMDATDYPIPPEKAVLFLFNPFGESVLRRVVQNIQRSLDEHPREIYIVYCIPILLGMFSQSRFELVSLTARCAVLRASA